MLNLHSKGARGFNYNRVRILVYKLPLNCRRVRFEFEFGVVVMSVNVVRNIDRFINNAEIIEEWSLIICAFHFYKLNEVTNYTFHAIFRNDI